MTSLYRGLFHKILMEFFWAAHNREAFMFPGSQYLKPILRQEGFLPYSERLEILHHVGGLSRIPWLGPAWTKAGFSLCRGPPPLLSLPQPARTEGCGAGSISSFCAPHSKHLYLSLCLWKECGRRRGGMQWNIQKLNIFLRVCISMVGLQAHECKAKGRRCSRCASGWRLSRLLLADFLHCLAWPLYLKVILSTSTCSHSVKIVDHLSLDW